MGISAAYSWIIWRQEPQGEAPSFVMSAKAIKLVNPCDIAENIATLSAHKVVGYALDSTLQPKITVLESVNNAAPTK